MIPLPHSSGPPAMPVPIDGCALCRRLDTAWRSARRAGLGSYAEKLAAAYIAHHARHTRH
ncbi:hypothetical protein [Streptomyces luteireticuli]|uniref:hypothetical protein n=1 Tax=Streptomyces luteireticuli TaxID=173858 RepID=UPI003557325D